MHLAIGITLVHAYGIVFNDPPETYKTSDN